MIQSPQSSDFIVVLPDNFLYERIKDMYRDWFDANNWLFVNINDFLASTLVRANFTGFTSSTNEQTKGKGSKKVMFRSGINLSESSNKQLQLTFRMTTGFLNYFILLDQLQAYSDSDNNSDNNYVTGDDAFLNNLTMFILNEEGQIAFERIYENIVFYAIDDISLDKESLKVRDIEFTVRFLYTDFKIKRNILKRVDITNEKYVY